jgi:peptidoglycan/LPS O-acetylase OafA/YrhL
VPAFLLEDNPTKTAITVRIAPMRKEPLIQSRIPLLDGIRAVAIGLVVLGHSINSPNRQFLSAMTGTFGVSVFLVLSGYLITRTILADERVHGKLRLGDFYRRRALRIFPAFYAFLIVLAGLAYIGAVSKPDRETWLASAVYFRNLAGSGWETGHLWSLALEEQFYLFWPVLFILTRRYRLRCILAAVAAFTIWRAIWVYDHHGVPIVIANVGGLYWRPDLRMDTFLIGGAFAIADWQWVRHAPAALAPLFLLLWCPFGPFTRFLAPVDPAVTAFVLATLIAWLVANPGIPVSRFLSQRAVVLIGTMSYSIYLWQELFLGPLLRWWSFPALAAVSAASWWFIESPFLRLRNRTRGARTMAGIRRGSPMAHPVPEA